MRAPITYYGGKQKLVKELLKLIPEHKHYIEPFMGGGALFFAKEPSKAETINDLNGEVSNFYRVLKSQFNELKILVEGTLHSRAIYKEALQIYKGNNPDSKKEKPDQLKRAWAFWVLTNQGYSGQVGSWALGRDSKIGKTLSNKRKQFSKDYAERLEHTQIECRDALKIIKLYDWEDAFFYLDPPYFNSDCGHYKGYTEEDFHNLLKALTTIKGKFLLSNYPSELLYSFAKEYGWRIKEKEQRISVSHKVKKKKRELMVYNYQLPGEEAACDKTGENASNENDSFPLSHRAIKCAPNLLLPDKAAMFACEPRKAKGMAKIKNTPEELRKFIRKENKKAVLNKKGKSKNDFSKSSENQQEDQREATKKNWNGNQKENQNEISTGTQTQTKTLEIIHEHKILYRGASNDYYVLGTLSYDMGSLPVTLMLEERAHGRRERMKIDLYDKSQVNESIKLICDEFGQFPEDLEEELKQLTRLLEEHRENYFLESKALIKPIRAAGGMKSKETEACIKFLSSKGLIKNIDALIEQAGVVGEESTRKLLFIIASTYKMATPLHALVQGGSGSGKSHLINTIGLCLPPEDVMSMTRVTSKSFYHYSKDELVDKVILIRDYDGLDEEAQFAFRELQSSGTISSSTTYKDRSGNIVSMMKTVKSHFASLLATSKAEMYYENMSRCIVLGVDETAEQTKRIIDYQNKKLAGMIDEEQQENAKTFLQNCLRCIKPSEVINPYADKVFLPLEARALRRLNSHYQAFVRQITILHQYQRKRDERGRLITEPEDLKLACDILFDAIMLKVDDLDSSMRQFFDLMKDFVKELAKESNKNPYDLTFTQRDVRLKLNISKATCFRYMEDLELLEYIQRTGGYANRGFKYKIVYWDDMEKTREQIKANLHEQLKKLNAPGGSPVVRGGSKGLKRQKPHRTGKAA